MIALGHQLGADDDVDLLPLHRPDELGGPGRRPDGVAGDDHRARLGEELRDFVGDPFDAGTAGDQAVLLAAFGAGLGRRHDMAAMVAGQPVHQPMLDHPGRAVGTLEAVTAMAAQRQRRETAAIEEQQRLFAGGEIGFQFGDQARRQPAPAGRRVLVRSIARISGRAARP